MGQPSAEIARLATVPAPVVDAYEAVFFCCRHHLRARDWIASHCLAMRGFDTEAIAEALLKSFAYHGGVYAFDAFAPYLIGGKDINHPPSDLATPEDRCEQLVRLILAVHLLPEHA